MSTHPSSRFVFGPCVQVNSSLTLEVDDDLLDLILKGEPYTLRGQPGANTALCTEFSTSLLRQVSSSNTLLLIEGNEENQENQEENHENQEENQGNLPTDDQNDQNQSKNVPNHSKNPPTYPQHIIPMKLQEEHTISSLVSFVYDAQPPTTTHHSYTFNQLLQLFPINKQFSSPHMKLLNVIYKQNRVLYYKLISSFKLDGFMVDEIEKNQQNGQRISQNQHNQAKSLQNQAKSSERGQNKSNTFEFGLEQDTFGSVQSSLSQSNPFNTQSSRGEELLRGLDGLEDQEENQFPKKSQKTSLYSKSSSKQSQKHSSSSSSNNYPASITIKKNRMGQTVLGTNNVKAMNEQSSISDTFNWANPTPINSLYGYDLSSLANIIQLSKYQLLHTLPQMPMILLENKYNLLSYDLIHNVISQIVDILSVLRSSSHTPLIDPSLFTKPNSITGLQTSTKGLVVSRNFLIHQIEADDKSSPCPLVAMSVLLPFIDWESTLAIYNPAPQPLNEEEARDEVVRARYEMVKRHCYKKYKKFFSKIQPSQTKSIPNTLPQYYNDFQSWSYHLNDLFGFDDSQYDDITDENPILRDQVNKVTNNPKNSLVSIIPPIFVISMSKITAHFTQHYTVEYHQQQNTNSFAPGLGHSKKHNLPTIPLEFLFKKLQQEKLLEVIMPSFSSFFVDLAGTTIIEDPIYNQSSGYQASYNIGAEAPTYPLTFNVGDYSTKAVLSLLVSNLHNPEFSSGVSFSSFNAPKDRFEYLFSIKKQWPVAALKPFLEGVVVYYNVDLEKARRMVGEKSVIEKMGQNKQNKQNKQKEEEKGGQIDPYLPNDPNNQQTKHLFPTKQLLKEVPITVIDALLLKFGRAVTTHVKDEKGEIYQTNVTYCSR